MEQFICFCCSYLAAHKLLSLPTVSFFALPLSISHKDGVKLFEISDVVLRAENEVGAQNVRRMVGLYASHGAGFEVSVRRGDAMFTSSVCVCVCVCVCVLVCVLLVLPMHFKCTVPDITFCFIQFADCCSSFRICGSLISLFNDIFSLHMRTANTYCLHLFCLRSLVG